MSVLGGRIAAQRWFRSRSRAIVGTSLVDVLTVGPVEVHLVRVEFSEGPAETYVVPLAGDRDAPELFASAIVDLMRSGGGEVPGAVGGLRVSGAHGDLEGLPPPILSRAEQTNTSVRFGERVMFKLYRALTLGPNPEVEVLRFLAAHALVELPTPRLLGEVEWVHGPDTAAVAMVQSFVQSRGDAWTTTLEGLTRWARSGDSRELACEASTARRLGTRTAAMHRALAAPTEDPAFAPEPVTSLVELGARLHDEVRTLLPRAPRLRAAAPAIDRLIEDRSARPVHAFRTRLHGDYHLGQVLVTPEGELVIIDFEGEPSRTLAERRAKGLPLRDVAGMLRSFAYAAATVRRRLPLEPHAHRAGPARDARLARTESWEPAVGMAFLDGWLEGVAGSAAAPASDDEARRILELHLVEKALYEVRYELDHRPDWVDIPIEGLVALAA